MLDRLGTLLLFLRSESEKTHLKGSVDYHDHRNGRGKTEDEVGGVVYDIRDVSETYVPAPELAGIDPSEYSGVGI